MQIKKTEINVDIELHITTGYIVSDFILQQIAPIHEHKYLTIQYTRMVCQWCLEFWNTYNRAPGKDIQNIFAQHKTSGRLEDDTVDLIEQLLSNLSEQYESQGVNEPFILDTAEKYFAKRKLELLQEKLSGWIQTDQIDKAEEAIAGHSRVKRPQSGSVDVLRDKSAIIAAMDEQRDILLELPKGLGELIGPIERGDFLSFIAPMKRGKTFWIEDFAVRLMFRQLKVLFVSLEMPRNQMMRRIYQNFLAETKMPKEITLPYFDSDDDICYKQLQKRGISSPAAIKKAEAIAKLIRAGSFRLICYPAYSANVADIRTELANLAHYDDFHPDAILVDYADILAPEPFAPKDYRHRINETWLELRKLAQDIHGLVITASQSDRSTFSKDVSEENTSEDIRKLAHVTHMIALNQTKEEKQQQVMRLSVLANRNEEFHTEDELTVLYNYAIGKAYLDSRWKKQKKS